MTVSLLQNAPAFEDAIETIADTLFPNGIDVRDDAPNTWQDCREYYQRTGRMCVAPAMDTTHILSNLGTFHKFRAWHDWVHITCGCQFTEAGENEAAIIQEAMLAARYGVDNAKAWLATVQVEVVDSNGYTRREILV